MRKFGDLKTLRSNLDQVGKMKFRYAGRVQQSLIENESVLEVSSRLTKINCEIESMQKVSIERDIAQIDRLRAMMDAQAMDTQRREKWEAYLANQ